MSLVGEVAQIVAPVFVLALVGVVWVKAGFEYRLEFVTRLGTTLAVPCLIFTALMTSDVDPAALGRIAVAAGVGYAALTGVFWGIVSALGLDRRTWLAPLIFGNTGNLGLPIALFAFGETGLGLAIAVFAVMAVWNFTFGIWLVSAGGSPWRVVKEPIVGATLLGALFLWQGWQTPLWMTRSLDLIGQMAIPLMLITLGVALARLNPGHLTRATALALLRAVVCVGVGLAVGWAMGLDPVAGAVLVVQMSTPVAVTSYLLAAKYGADATQVAGLVVVSTLLSVASLPLTLGFLIG